MEQTALVADLPGLSCGICFLRTRFGLTVAQRGNQLLRTEQPPLFPASLRTGCADRKRVRPLVGRNWRQGSLEETKPAWKTTQLLGRAFDPAVNTWVPRLVNCC